MVTDTRTPNRNYPVPNVANYISDEFPRLITALDLIDSDVAGLLTSVAGKAPLVHTHAIADVVGLQTALSALMPINQTFTLAGLTDVNGAAGATNLQVLKFVNGKWQPSTIAYGEVTGTPSLGSAASLNVGTGAGNIPQLDSTGKFPSALLPAAVFGSLNYQGIWNASTNTPTLASGQGTKGFYYKVSTAGTTSIDGLNVWNVGDSIVFDGTTWDKIDGIANEVISVAGLAGAISAGSLKSALGLTWTDIGSRPTALSAFANDVGYLNGISSSLVTNALGYTPYSSNGGNLYGNTIQMSPATGAGYFSATRDVVLNSGANCWIYFQQNGSNVALIDNSQSLHVNGNIYTGSSQVATVVVSNAPTGGWPIGACIYAQNNGSTQIQPNGYIAGSALGPIFWNLGSQGVCNSPYGTWVNLGTNYWSNGQGSMWQRVA